jgi:lipid-A-disaccharide synthase
MDDTKDAAPLVYVVAGEQSGDLLGARLIAALRAASPRLRFAGVGGPRMAEQGVQTLFPMQELAVMGLVEVLPRLHRLRRRLAETVADVLARRPAVLVTIDSPGFTLRLLRRLHGKGIRRVHYVAPQVWAWKERRVRSFPGLWDRLLCLFPFEPEFFASHGLEAVFVGHPVLQSGVDGGSAARFRATHSVPENAPVLVLMPGSRRSEASRLLPVFAATLSLLAPKLPNLVPVIPTAPAVAGIVREASGGWTRPPLVVSDLTDKHDAYAAAAAALTKSGTSTLELALAGVPMAVTYRINPVSAMLAAHMLRIPHVAMVNILAGRAVVPELLQRDCTPQKLAAVVSRLLGDGSAVAEQRAAFREVRSQLAAPFGTPAEAAARAVLSVLEGHG